MSYHKTIHTILITSLCLAFLSNASHATADTVTPASCNTLSVSLSDDKNFYILAATSKGDSHSITGYTFDFGDHQTYRLRFSANTSKDRHAASVTHVYRDAGTYTARVSVAVNTGGKVANVSSAGCQTNVVIPPPATTLPNTGAYDAPALFMAASLGGGILHHLWRRHRIRSTR